MMRKLWLRAAALAIAAVTGIMPLGSVLAQAGEAASTPAGLSMLMLFMGIAGIVGVFVIRWTQSTPDDDD